MSPAPIWPSPLTSICSVASGPLVFTRASACGVAPGASNAALSTKWIDVAPLKPSEPFMLAKVKVSLLASKLTTWSPDPTPESAAEVKRKLSAAALAVRSVIARHLTDSPHDDAPRGTLLDHAET
jgi:hypothetical protein